MEKFFSHDEKTIVTHLMDTLRNDILPEINEKLAQVNDKLYVKLPEKESRPLQIFSNYVKARNGLWKHMHHWFMLSEIMSTSWAIECYCMNLKKQMISKI